MQKNRDKNTGNRDGPLGQRKTIRTGADVEQNVTRTVELRTMDYNFQ
jgi:hypothetical protein